MDPLVDAAVHLDVEAAIADSPDAGRLAVSRGGRFFSCDGRDVRLTTRKPLARILEALLERATAGAAGMTRQELVEAGWPGEKILPQAARIRLRVAISTLRSLGLGGRIETTATGYALVGDIIVMPEPIALPIARPRSPLAAVRQPQVPQVPQAEADAHEPSPPRLASGMF